MFFCIGNDPGNQNGGIVIDVDQSGAITFEFALSEQGACAEIVHDGSNLIIPGIDPTESWDFGNIYTRDDALGIWTKVRTMTNVIHSFGACIHDNGELYVATGVHTGDETTFRGYVFRSADLGQNWSSVQVSNYRVYDIESYNGNLYAIADEFGSRTFYYSTDDGDTWSQVAGIVPSIFPRMVHWNSQLAFVANSGEIYVVDSLNSVTLKNPPPQAVSSAFNALASHGGFLYALCGDRIYRTVNFNVWQYYCNLGRQCTGLSVWDGFGLIVSEIGTDARLLRIPL